MFGIPDGLAGAVTVVFFVGLGIFGYPWLLNQRHGRLAVAVATVALTALFYYFDRASGSRNSQLSSLLFGYAWAVLPVIAGIIVWRIQRPKVKAE